jgi:hypothetical protein
MLFTYWTWYRMLWLKGRFAGGKTSLSVKLAVDAIDRGYARYIVSNTRLFLGKHIDTISAVDVGDVVDSVILMDEAWRHLKTGKHKNIEQWMAYISKQNNYLLMPSVMKLTGEARQLSVQRIWNGPAYGVPLWIYSYALDTGDEIERGKYNWWSPHSIFGTYDHEVRESADFYVYDCDLSEDSEHGDNGEIESQSGGGGYSTRSGVEDQLCDNGQVVGAGGGVGTLHGLALVGDRSAGGGASDSSNGASSGAGTVGGSGLHASSGRIQWVVGAGGGGNGTGEGRSDSW